jgi:putative ABC transport system permease protein
MTTIVQDLRYALRSFRKSPAFALVAVATLALGVGANSAIFALVDRVLLDLLPVKAPKELVLLSSPGPLSGHVWSDGDVSTSFSYPMYRDFKNASGPVFSGILAEYPFDASVATATETDRARAELVSGNYFDVLGVVPAVGRTLTPDDDRIPGGHPVVVLSHGYWTRRFGGNAAILNKRVSVNGHAMTVVGVARAGYPGIQPGRPTDVFVPMMMKAQMTPAWNGLDDPKDYWLQMVGRLRPGVSRERGQVVLQAIYAPMLRDLSRLLPNMKEATRKEFLAKKLLLLPGGHGRLVLQHDLGRPLVSLMALVALVLLIACSNLAGLLAARGVARQREYGIRLAIGASRGQLLRQSILECLVFAVVGGALGIVVAAWILNALVGAFPAEAELRQVAARIDPRVFGFAALLSLAAGLFFGISPALRAARLDPAHTLQGTGRGSASSTREVLRFRQWLVTAQVALTLVLLIAAGLFVGSLRSLGRVDLGLKPDHVIGFSIAPESNGYEPARTLALARSLTEGVKALPGVRSVSAAELSTLTGNDSGSNVTMEGADPNPDQPTRVLNNWIGPEYFSTLGIPLLSGREFAWRDDESSTKVAIVNEAFVKRFTGGRDPVGLRFRFGRGNDNTRPWMEIVGVVRNSKSTEVSEPDRPYAFVPYAQDKDLGQLSFYLRCEGDPGLLAASLRAEVRRLDSRLPVFDVRTLTEQVHDSLATQRVVTILSAAFGILAALLAAIGIYGVLAFAVAERRREIGVRVALGAQPAAVRNLILKEVFRFLVVGTGIGLPAAYGLSRAVESILFGVKAGDVRVFIAGVAVLITVSLAAGYPPARRAAATNPMEALRSE